MNVTSSESQVGKQLMQFFPEFLRILIHSGLTLPHLFLFLLFLIILIAVRISSGNKQTTRLDAWGLHVIMESGVLLLAAGGIGMIPPAW